MMVKKILLVAGAVALMSTPAWALPGHAPSNDGTSHAPSTTPVGPSNDGDHGGDHPGKSHKCKPHKVAYVAAGLLVSQTLTLDGTEPPPTTAPTASSAALHQNGDDTWSGDVTVDVKRTNHHARGDKGKTVTYTVSHVHVTFGLQDVNNDGSVGLDDLQPNARVKVIGKITSIARKCDHTGFTPEITIRRVIFHAPASSSPNP